MIAALALVVVAAAANPRLEVGLDEHVGARVPLELTFTSSTGQRVALGELFDGRPVVLVLAYARCPMLCSVVLRAIADAARATPPTTYRPVVISLDPDETADEGARRQNTLLADIRRPGDRTAWPYLVGDAASIATLAGVLGFRYAWDPATHQFAHPAVAFVLTPDGRIAEYLRGVSFDDLPGAVARASSGVLTVSLARDILTCFHFDPSLRRHGAAIALMLRLGAAVVLAALLALVLGLVRWERRAHR